MEDLDFEKDNTERMLAALAVYLGLTEVADWDALSKEVKAEAKAKYEADLSLKTWVEEHKNERIPERDVQIKIANLGKAEGVQLYKIKGESSDGKMCEHCKQWQDEIVSMGGNPLGYRTVQDFINSGGFHINCRCSLQELQTDEIPRKAREWLSLNNQPKGDIMENDIKIENTIDNGETVVQVATIGKIIGSDADGNPVEQNLTEEALEKLAETHKDTEILVDADHESELGHKTEAKGWLSGLFVEKGTGLFGKIKWTDIGRKLIENRVFRWLSPSWYLNDKKEPVKMTSVALTNKPSQEGFIDPIVNSAPVEMTEEKDTSEDLTNEKGILDMTKEELAAMVAEIVDSKLAEAKKAETVEEVKEEIKEDTTDNTCSCENEKVEVKNDEPVVEEKADEDKVEDPVEKKDDKEEVIKIESLNSQPKTTGIDIIKNSEPVVIENLFKGIKVTRII